MKEIFELFEELGDKKLNELIEFVTDSVGHELKGMNDLVTEVENMVSTSASQSALNNGCNLTDDAFYNLGKKHSTGNGAPFDYEIAVKLFHKAAEAGHADAQFELAFAYLTLPAKGDWSDRGKTFRHIQEVLNGVIPFNAETVEEATKWLEKAAASGHEEAIEWLEWISEVEIEESDIEPLKTDSEENIELEELKNKLKKKSNYTSSDDLFSTAKDYKKGHNGKTQDDKIALSYFSQAGDKGHIEAAYRAALQYRQGIGCNYDFNMAEKYYLISAKKDHMKAQYNLANLYRDTKNKNPNHAKEALKWYKKAGKNGSMEAYYNAAEIHLNGWLGKPDYKAAEKLLIIPANANNIDAQFNLGILYSLGGHGIIKDYKKAAHWFQSGADLGDNFALFKLCNIHSEGGHNLKYDELKALECYKEGALKFGYNPAETLDIFPFAGRMLTGTPTNTHSENDLSCGVFIGGMVVIFIKQKGILKNPDEFYEFVKCYFSFDELQEMLNWSQQTKYKKLYKSIVDNYMVR